ncbi:SRPBCC domain-containing protein [Phenylobacterium sp.]|uniref:SRPBCC domain-containing protein n=1 Tax=Phenylobacterium sp. TaxID=1871053 RepID=UPI00289C76AF|nr:SRPBCC domain-containing protein [Phenylobacterium sp.]
MTATDATVLQDDELLIERIFDAPPELVFRVWTKPEHLMRWWGPKDFTVTAFEQDFRVGGAYRSCIRDPSGGDHWMAGVYREIVDGERIIMTFRWEDGAFDVDNLVTVTFARLAGGRTLFRFHQAPFATVEARDSHTGGWASLVDKLVAYLATEDAR